ncbi:MAG: 50S ribosomal protein L18 [Chloroflexi bacterium]|nr:50S ribosomal protein L18 [Chloroflexota bacterium]
MAVKSRNAARKRRHLRVRSRVSGTPDQPRLNVFRSLGGIYAQLIDDGAGHTLAAASTNDAGLRAQIAGKKKAEQARIVGETLARRARERGISRVVFDRGGYKYHGRVKALAEAAREAGLEF